jgi:serine/threonine protein phosphatase PrpC
MAALPSSITRETEPRITLEKLPDIKPPFQRVFDTVYARKARTTLEKLTHQLKCALIDGESQQKMEGSPPFELSTPPELVELLALHPSFSAAVAQHVGSKSFQEDRYLLNCEVEFISKGETLKGRLFGVFDGHGDAGCVGEYLARNLGVSLGQTLTELATDGVTDEVVANAFARIFPQLSSSYPDFGGATATCAFLTAGKVYCPNVGDSRIILVKKDQTYQLTEDANVGNIRFRKWHWRAGNGIAGESYYKLRVYRYSMSGNWYSFLVARDIGAFSWMCPRPKITRIYIDDKPDDLDKGEIYCGKGDFLVLASDGLYEPATKDEIGAAIRQLAQAGATPQIMANLIANKAASSEGNDNVTVMIVPL